MTYRILKVLTSSRGVDYHTVGLGFSREFAEELVDHLNARYASEPWLVKDLAISFKVEPDQQNVVGFSYGRR